MNGASHVDFPVSYAPTTTESHLIESKLDRGAWRNDYASHTEGAIKMIVAFAFPFPKSVGNLSGDANANNAIAHTG